jgi:hypothetical protein
MRPLPVLGDDLQPFQSSSQPKRVNHLSQLRYLTKSAVQFVIYLKTYLIIKTQTYYILHSWVGTLKDNLRLSYSLSRHLVRSLLKLMSCKLELMIRRIRLLSASIVRSLLILFLIYTLSLTNAKKKWDELRRISKWVNNLKYTKK